MPGTEMTGQAGLLMTPTCCSACSCTPTAPGTRSSRQIERHCEVDVAYRVICANRAPDHSTFARSRQAHDKLAQSLFVQVLALCANAGLAKAGVIAIDGTKMGGDASMGANCTLSQLQVLVGQMFRRSRAHRCRGRPPFRRQKRGDELPGALAEPNLGPHAWTLPWPS